MTKSIFTILMLLASLGVLGCSKQRQATRLPSVAPAATAPAPAPLSASTGELRKMGIDALRQSAKVLEELTDTRSEIVPDAVLSRAKCLVLQPAVGKQAQGSYLRATAACRIGNSWGSPTFAKLSGIPATLSNPAAMAERPDLKRTDLLIFIMSTRAQKALLAGTVNLASDVAVNSGPLTKQGAIVTDVELKGSDGLAYLHSGGKLYGSAVSSGTLQLDAEMSKRVYGRPATPTALLEGSSARSSAADSFNVMVNSFFYMIRPGGIIIHHSVLVPEPAVADRELDQFHSKRGFSIYCFGHVYHVAYHYLILPDGAIKAGRPERCQGAHTRGYNSYLGIALVGDFSTQDNPQGKKGQLMPTEAQMRSLLELTRQLRQRYSIPLHRILRHSDISSTYCPGDRFLFRRFLADLEKSVVPRGF